MTIENLAVFDLDNTLIDSDKKLRMDIVNAMKLLGHELSPEEVSGDWYTLARGYGVSKAQFDWALDRRKSWARSLEDEEVGLFEDTVPCLEGIKEGGVGLALLSRSIPDYTYQKLRHFGLEKYFKAVETVHPKTQSKREGAIKIVKSFYPKGLNKAYFLGDREEDVIIAEDVSLELGIKTEGIWVNRTAKPITDSLRRYQQVSSLENVPALILGRS